MIESIMYFGIGFLIATIIAVAVIPFVHSRAVRLTIRRMEHSIPQSMAEIQADKDTLRAQFAMSTRRLEITIDELKNKHTNALAELGRKGNAVNWLKIERAAEKVEVVALKAEIVTLKDQLAAAGKEIEAVKVRRRADDLISLVPKDRPASGELQNDAADPHDPRQRVEPAEDRSDVRASLQAAGSVIRVSPSIGKRMSINLVHLFMVVLVSFGAAFAWQHYHAEEAKEVARMVSSLGSLLFVSKTRSPLDVDVTARQPGSTPAPQEPAHDAGNPQPAPVTETSPAAAAAEISPPHSEIAAKQEQLPDERQSVEHPIQQESRPLQNDTTSPQTGQTPLQGWTLREVTNGIAVLEGPTGIWRVAPGEAVPGVGKVESYIRSNGQWLVATSSGLISMPVAPNASSPPLQSDTKPTPTPEVNPKTIEGWTLREVINGTAVLQGPVGMLRVTLGDTVAGLGKVTAIARWGKGWVVATSAGYCTSATEHGDGICKPYRRDQ